ncbi:hypothetical protein HYE44_03075 [Mycoplasmopsis bovis]|nr:hypothetical protein HYE44_03075 [Mycoplasmopsis bovis]
MLSNCIIDFIVQKTNYGTYPLVSSFWWYTSRMISEELTKNNYYSRDYYKIKNYIESTKDYKKISEI